MLNVKMNKMNEMDEKVRLKSKRPLLINQRSERIDE